jgi:hypothetical protein
VNISETDAKIQKVFSVHLQARDNRQLKSLYLTHRPLRLKDIKKSGDMENFSAQTNTLSKNMGIVSHFAVRIFNSSIRPVAGSIPIDVTGFFN